MLRNELGLYFNITFSLEQEGTLHWRSIALAVIVKTRFPRNLQARQASVLLTVTSI